MKLKIFVVVIVVVVAWLAGRHFIHFPVAGSGDSRSFAASAGDGRQLINDSYALSPGARVEVSGINGPVEIVTTDGATAEVHVENEASDARDLQYHQIAVEHGADYITIRGQNRSGGWGFLRWLTGRGGGSRSARQSVVLKVPRRVEVAARGVNGELKIGEVEGAVRVSNVNGPVTVARASGRADVSGVNGPITLAVGKLDEGVRVSGVNGDIELKLAADTNADVDVGGLMGSVTNDLKNASVDTGSDNNNSKFSARVGAGGPPIRLSGIRGNVHLANV